MKFFPNAAPKHLENFKKLSQGGFYNGTLFHRIDKDLLYKVEIQIQDKMAPVGNNGDWTSRIFVSGRIKYRSR
jgi:cyclophilin family peptidyl-prolyl cis-trans isomerase